MKTKLILLLIGALFPLALSVPAATIMSDLGTPPDGALVNDVWNDVNLDVITGTDLENYIDDIDGLTNELSIWPDDYPDISIEYNWGYEDCHECIEEGFRDAVERWNWRQWVSLMPTWDDLDSPVDYFYDDEECYAYHLYSSTWNDAAEEVNDRIENDYVYDIDDEPHFVTQAAKNAAWLKATDVCAELYKPGLMAYQKNMIQMAKGNATAWSYIRIKRIFDLSDPEQELWISPYFDMDIEEPTAAEGVEESECIELLSDYFFNEIFPALETAWRGDMWDAHHNDLSMGAPYSEFAPPSSYAVAPHKPRPEPDNWPSTPPQAPSPLLPVRGAP